MRLARVCFVAILVIWGLAYSFHYFDMSLFSTWYGYPLTVTSIVLVIAIPLLVDSWWEPRKRT
jgi:hypothetical protein